MARPRLSTHKTGHVVQSEDVARLVPFRDRKIPVTSLVPCAIHGAEIGEPCLSPSGKRATCAVRRRLALRKLNEEKADG